MKSEKLLDAIGMVGEDLILEAKAPRKRHLNWKQWTAMAACLALLITVLSIIKPFQPGQPDSTGPDSLHSNPITIPFTSPSDAPSDVDPTQPSVQTDPTLPQDPTEPPYQDPTEPLLPTDPTEPPYRPGSIMQLSASPDNAYIGSKPFDPSNFSASLHYDFFYIEACAVEILPDTYTTYSIWNSNELRIVKMQTTFSYENHKIPEEFYLVLQSKFVVDFTQYDTLVLPYMCQYGAENSILYNVTQESAEAFDLLLFGSPHFDGGSTIYAFTDEVFDMSLWTINDVWTEDSEVHREHGVEFHTLEEARLYFEDDYGYVQMHVASNSDITFEEGIAALEYVKPFENGIFALQISSFLTDNFSYRRYINGIPTNERIYISVRNETVNRSGTAFTQADIDAIPDVASAIVTVEDAFQNGLIPPPHILNYQEMKLHRHGVIGWFFKAYGNVYGAVQVNFSYYDADKKEFLHDDIYFLIEPDSKICIEISRDELQQLQGTNDFLFTGDYDSNGKVRGDYPFG